MYHHCDIENGKLHQHLKVFELAKCKKYFLSSHCFVSMSTHAPPIPSPVTATPMSNIEKDIHYLSLIQTTPVKREAKFEMCDWKNV